MSENVSRYKIQDILLKYLKYVEILVSKIIPSTDYRLRYKPQSRQFSSVCKPVLSRRQALLYRSRSETSPIPFNYSCSA